MWRFPCGNKCVLLSLQLENEITMKMNRNLFLALLLPLLFCVSCSEKAPSKDVFYLNNDSAGGHGKQVVYDFNGELASDSALWEDYAFCRQQQAEGSDCYFAVFPEENYVGFCNGNPTIRLFQHQQYLPTGIGLPACPKVAFGKLKEQEFSNVCGGLQVLLKGNATVTALRFTDNDTIDRLWGNYAVRHIGMEDQQLLALSSSEGNNEVWLDCPEGVALSNDTAKAFTVMLPSGAFYRGFAMDVFCGDSVLYHIATEKCNTIVRGKMHRMSELVIR